MSPSSTSLSITVAHAVAYLTRPLAAVYSATTIIKLQLVLEANLTALYAPLWVPREPLRGSGRRCLTFSPDCLPPRAIYNACLAAGVQWFDWIAVLGGREFDFFVDPGCISMRFGKEGSGSYNKLYTVWSDSDETPTATVFDEASIQAQLRSQAGARAVKKTLAQQLLENDEEEDDQLFAMIADEVSAPTWMTPILDQFPVPRSTSPLSFTSSHSRSSSRSSNSSSGFSFSSSESGDSFGSFTTPSTASSPEKVVPKQSRRERARQARVFVDTTKTEVTPYDGGKTTVLTGGVMLGGGKPSAAASKKTPKSTNFASNWRSPRA
jgi:BTG family